MLNISNQTLPVLTIARLSLDHLFFFQCSMVTWLKTWFMTHWPVSLTSFLSVLGSQTLLSPLASSPFMVSEASHQRMHKRQGQRKGELATICHNFHFYFAQMKRNTDVPLAEKSPFPSLPLETPDLLAHAVLTWLLATSQMYNLLAG